LETPVAMLSTARLARRPAAAATATVLGKLHVEVSTACVTWQFRERHTLALETLGRGLPLQDGSRRLATQRAPRHDDKKGEDAEESAKSEAADGTTTWGDKFMLFGLVLRGAAALPRFAGAAGVLRFAGAGPMLLGAVISVYELGGWRLVVSIPILGVAAVSADAYFEGIRQDRVREELVHDVQESCPDMAAGALEALRSARVRQFENNRFRLEAQWIAATSGGRCWRIEASGVRPNRTSAWTVAELRVLVAMPTSSSETGGRLEELAPQTRFWDAHGPQLQWETTWQRTLQ